MIILIGYMGSGKTTLGQAVARRTGMRFVDLDDYIESRAGITVKEIFATRGEAAFRDMEREAIAALGADSETVVACGGGTPCFGDNMAALNRMGTTVYLKAPHSRLLERLKLGRDKRPLIAALDDEALSDFITSQLAWREPYYSRALVTFDSSRLDDEEQLEESVDKFVKLILKK